MKGWKFRNVTYDGKAITGEKAVGTPSKDNWCKFSATPNLMAIELAMYLNDTTITEFMALADGYGSPGFFPSGYDWPGIRDSSHGSLACMFQLARRRLDEAGGEKALTALGLPREVAERLLPMEPRLRIVKKAK
jgi:hypothetical protein